MQKNYVCYKSHQREYTFQIRIVKKKKRIHGLKAKESNEMLNVSANKYNERTTIVRFLWAMAKYIWFIFPLLCFLQTGHERAYSACAIACSNTIKNQNGQQRSQQ